VKAAVAAEEGVDPAVIARRDRRCGGRQGHVYNRDVQRVSGWGSSGHVPIRRSLERGQDVKRARSAVQVTVLVNKQLTFEYVAGEVGVVVVTGAECSPATPHNQ